MEKDRPDRPIVQPVAIARIVEDDIIDRAILVMDRPDRSNRHYSCGLLFFNVEWFFLEYPRNPKVRGSNPLPATKDFKDLHRFGVSPFY